MESVTAVLKDNYKSQMYPLILYAVCLYNPVYSMAHRTLSKWSKLILKSRVTNSKVGKNTS